MNLITKLSPRAFMQQVRRNRGIYSVVKALKCTSAFRYILTFFSFPLFEIGQIHQTLYRQWHLWYACCQMMKPK